MENNVSILLAHPGTQYSYHIARQLNKKKMLFFFITGFCFTEKSAVYFFYRICPKYIQRKLSNRLIRDFPAEKLKTNFTSELLLMIKQKIWKAREEFFFERNNKFQNKISDKYLLQSDIVIGFDTSSLILAKRANFFKKKFILDVSIAHSISKIKTYEILNNLYPNWHFSLTEKKQSFIEIENAELQNANAVVVASSFTKRTLMENGVNEEKIYINPYGINLKDFCCKNFSQNHSDKIKFLFTGLIDARKGVPFLLTVWNSFTRSGKASLTLVGPIDKLAEKNIRQHNFTDLDIIRKIPHTEIPDIIITHDVFVFPSFFEGFGLVILEAMACGLPVITTSATGGPDIIEHGKEGFIIEPGNEEQLKKAIQFFVDHPQQIEIMGRAARRKAEQYTWDAYGERWVEIIEELSKVETGV